MHRVFGEHIYTELFARFSEAPLSIKGKDVGVDAAPFVPMDEVKELEGHLLRRFGKGAVNGSSVIIVDAGVLVVERAVENTAT